MIKRFVSPFFIIIFLIIIGVPVILPYFHAGYFPTHDGEWAVVRLGDMFRSLRDHQFPVRYSGNLNFGYGYPLFNFTYPAPYYIGTLFHFFKLGFVNSLKLLFALSVVISGVGMYLLSNEVWKNKFSGVISAILYIYLPYRIVDLYARGSVGESLSFALFPLILFCAAKILDEKQSNRYIILGPISYALLVMSHNIMALLFTPLLLLFIGFKLYLAKGKGFVKSLLFIILSYALSAFFWLPALLEKHNILLSKIPIADRNIYFVHLYQIIIPKWGYGLPNQPDGFSYQIGLAQIVVLFLIIGFLLYLWLIKREIIKTFYFKLTAILAAATVLFILLMFSFTGVIWQITPLLKEINYPWTLLSPIGFLISLLSGFLWIQNKIMKYTLVCLCALAVVLIFPHAKPSNYIDKGDQYYLTNDATTTSSQELMPLWVRTEPSQRPDKKVELINGKGKIQNISSNSHFISFNLDLKSASLIRINTIYYPGWNISVDDKNSKITYTNDLGVMEIAVPQGQHTVIGKFSETPMRLVSDMISLVGLVVLIFLSLLPRQKFEF